MSREFDGTSTTVINAATKPIVSRYLERLERSLGDAGFPRPGHDHAVERWSHVGRGRSTPTRRDPDVGPVGGVAGAAALTRRGEESSTSSPSTSAEPARTPRSSRRVMPSPGRSDTLVAGR